MNNDSNGNSNLKSKALNAVNEEEEQQAHVELPILKNQTKENKFSK